jgi:hypothetical protein
VTIQDQIVPRRFSFDPQPIGVNSETAACRLRDAVRSLLTGMTTDPNIDPTLLAERYRHYMVTHDGTHVFVVPRAEKKTDSTSLSVDHAHDSDVLAVIQPTDVDVIRAFALLLGRRILQGKVLILGTLTTETTDSLMHQHDIALISNSDNTMSMF